jgi:hypothetical protein
MTYYILTFHKVGTDGIFREMVDNPMVFDSWAGAHDYGRHHVDYTHTNFRIHETVLFSSPKTVDNN